MAIQKDIGIILSSKTYGEGDVFSRIFTKNFGKKDFIFKGIKKSKKRSSLGSEPGTIIEFIYYDQKKSIPIINEFKVERVNLEIRKNYNQIFQLCFLLEIVEKTVGDHDPNEKIFNLLFYALSSLSQTEFKINFSLFFIIHLLKHHGILSPFERCKICDGQDYDNFFIDQHDFSPICQNCRTGDLGEKLFSVKTKEFVQKSLSQKFINIDHGQYDQKTNKNFLNYISLFIENYFNIRIKSREMMLA